MNIIFKTIFALALLPTLSVFSVAEIWDDLDISNADAHRQALCGWMDASWGNIRVL